MKLSQIREIVEESIDAAIESILEQEVVEEGVYDPAIFKAIFLAGGPGSGKTYTRKRITSGLGFTVINSDDVLEFLADRDGSTEAVRRGDMLGMEDFEKENAELDEIRARAKKTINTKYRLQIQGRKGVIIDGTGRDFKKIHEQSEELRELGYDTKMILVNTSLDTALERNEARTRRVKENIVRESWQAVQNNIGKFQHYFGRNNFSVIDNNTASSKRDQHYRDEIANDIWVEIRDFARDKPQNPIAIQWIEQELEARRR
jgi:dephospho-CoA kinase